MRLRYIAVWMFVLAGAVAMADAKDEDHVADAEVRAAIQRSLPVLETDGVAWMTQKNCASCHHVPFLIWSHNAAREHGIAVDETKLEQWIAWTAKFSQSRRAWFKLSKQSLDSKASGDVDDTTRVPAEVLNKLAPLVDRPFASEGELVAEMERLLTRQELAQHRKSLLIRASRPLEPDNDGGGLDTLSQLLLGRGRQVADASDAAAQKARAVDWRDVMLRWQQRDGSWKAAGQLPAQNRPVAETHAVSTMWAMLALAGTDHPDKPTQSAIARAAEFLQTKDADASKHVSGESLLLRLLVAHELANPDRADALVKEVLAHQNADGGWAWRQSGPSDAFATGQALYALRRAGVAADRPPLARACDYLVRTQASAGWWTVPSRAISSATNDGRLKRLEPIYRYWGTAWAVIGLSDTLR